jgi:hypothetical protein
MSGPVGLDGNDVVVADRLGDRRVSWQPDHRGGVSQLADRAGGEDCDAVREPKSLLCAVHFKT